MSFQYSRQVLAGQEKTVAFPRGLCFLLFYFFGCFFEEPQLPMGLFQLFVIVT